MILYLDSSSVVKLYIDEEGTGEVRALRDEVGNVFLTSRMTYVEVRSALARRRSEGWFGNEADYRRATLDFNRDWSQGLQRIAVSEAVVRRAGDLAENHALKGYDAVHLASALALKQRIGDQVSFSTWDDALRRAAAAEGLAITHEEATL